MFKTTYKGKKNLIGENLKKLRLEKFPNFSQREFAEKLQLNGFDIGKNRVSRIELGECFVNDIELQIIARTLDVKIEDLITWIPVSQKPDTGETYSKSEKNTVKKIAEKPEDSYTALN